MASASGRLSADFSSSVIAPGLRRNWKRHQAVAVQRRGHMGAAGVERGPNRPADLPMLFATRAQKARPRERMKLPLIRFQTK